MLGNQWRGGVDELLQIAAQLVQAGAAGAQHAGCRFVVQKSQQEVLHGHEFMTFCACLLEGKVEGDFELSI